MDRVAVDLLALPVTENGYVGVCVMIDVFTKYCWAGPIRDKTTRSVAKTLFRVMSDFGRIRMLQSDNGSEFVSKLAAEFCQVAGVEQVFVSPYNPRANGVVERVNRVIVGLLRKLACFDPRRWDDHLDMALHAYRSKVHASTGFSPFYLMLGRESSLLEPWRAEEIAISTEVEMVWEQLQKLTRLHLLTFDQVHTTQEEGAAKQRAGQDRRAGHTLDEGGLSAEQEVWVRRPRPKAAKTTMEKLKPLFNGPYWVKGMNRAGNYILENKAKQTLDRSYPRNQLKASSHGNDIELPWSAEPVRLLETREGVLGQEVRVRWMRDQGRTDIEEWLAASDMVGDETAMEAPMVEGNDSQDDDEA